MTAPRLERRYRACVVAPDGARTPLDAAGLGAPDSIAA
jgi:hypothetical protein